MLLPLSSAGRPSFTISKIFSSETDRPIKAKLHVEHPYEGGMKVYINGKGHMTKMAAMPIYGKNHKKIFFSGTGGPISKKLDMQHQGLWPIIVYINHDLGLALTYFLARSILVT